jgi:predicted PurR-regulated permease PerM
MADCKTFWVVTISMIIIVLIVVLLSFYMYKEIKHLAKKGDDLYIKSNIFLNRGTDVIDRANSTLDNFSPVADLVKANLPMLKNLKINL